MKKISAFLLVILITFLGACAPQTPPEPVLDFTADVFIDGTSFTDGAFDISAEVTSTSHETAVITITSPDELWGLRYKWVDGFEMIYLGLHCKTEKGYLPADSFAEAIYNVLSSLKGEGVAVSFNGKVAVFSGECPSGKYKVTTDKKGYIQNISIEEINLHTEFTYK